MKKKILCLCSAGAVRSVTLAFVLKYKYKHDALAASMDKNSESTLKMLYEWADLIIAVTEGLHDSIPMEYLDKSTWFDIGEDVWKQSLAPELVTKCLSECDKNLKLLVK